MLYGLHVLLPEVVVHPERPVRPRASPLSHGQRLVVVLQLVGGVAQHAVQQRRLPRLQLLPDHLGRLVSQLVGEGEERKILGFFDPLLPLSLSQIS